MWEGLEEMPPEWDRQWHQVVAGNAMMPTKNGWVADAGSGWMLLLLLLRSLEASSCWSWIFYGGRKCVRKSGGKLFSN